MDRITAAELASARFKANPYPLYARLRAESPLCRTTYFGYPMCFVTRYDDVVMALKDDRLSKDWKGVIPGGLYLLLRPIARNMLSLDPPDHTRLRTLVTKAFTPRMVERLRNQIQTVCDDLLDAATTNGRMDLVSGYASPLPLTVIGEMLGIPPGDRKRFPSWSRRMVEAFFNIRVLLALPDLWLFNRYLRKLFAERRARPKDDLITALVQAEEAGDTLSEEELQAMVTLLLIAGYETTVHLIASGALALIQDPEQRERLLQNPALAEPAVEELLRYASPLDIANPRVARVEFKMGEATIRRGELVFPVIGSANHDESQFADPEKLDISREPNKHVAFGQGIHFCLGAPLARLEGQIALTTLFRRFPHLRLAQPAESLPWRKNLFLRALEALPVAF